MGHWAPPLPLANNGLIQLCDQRGLDQRLDHDWIGQSSRSSLPTPVLAGTRASLRFWLRVQPCIFAFVQPIRFRNQSFPCKRINCKPTGAARIEEKLSSLASLQLRPRTLSQTTQLAQFNTKQGPVRRVDAGCARRESGAASITLPRTCRSMTKERPRTSDDVSTRGSS